LTSRLSRRSLIASIGASAAVAGFPAIVRAQAPAATLRVGCAATNAFAEAYFAQSQGYFAAAGLDVTLTTLPNGGAIAAAVAGGAVDIGCGTPVQIAAAHLSGLPFLFFAPGNVFVDTDPSALLMVAKNSPITKAADLRGKTLADVDLGGLTSVSVHAWLADAGVEPNTMHQVEMPFGSMASALAAGRVDAAFIGEPALTGSLDATRMIGNPFASIAKRYFLSSWYATKPWLETNTATATKFLKVMQRTAVWVNRNRAASADLLSTYAKLPPDIGRKMHRGQFAENLDLAMLQPVFDVSFKGGLLKAQVLAKDMVFPL
jgi:NitT/TauT family transport system substrate-binding protein